MKTQQDILHGRSLEDVAEAARAYEETHAPFDKRPMNCLLYTSDAADD